MPLLLTIRNASALSNGSPTRFEADRRSLVIGRAPTSDWCLPDEKMHISSRHCEVRYTPDYYELIDTSTNGTFIAGSATRLAAPHVLREGDIFRIGPFEIIASLDAAHAGPTPLDLPGSAALAQPPQGWQDLAAASSVDWARAGFGTSLPPGASPGRRMAPRTGAKREMRDKLARSVGLDPRRLVDGEAETIERAGELLRSAVSGVMLLLEARARAKAQMGAKATEFSTEGNNPLKFARTPEDALAQLLNPPAPGYIEGERAMEDACRDLQTHQVATLRAMQGALRATLARFSPDAIRTRATQRGLLARLMRRSEGAALWDAYVAEFEGVADGADQAFIEVFANEFRRAYDSMTGSG